MMKYHHSLILTHKQDEHMINSLLNTVPNKHQTLLIPGTCGGCKSFELDANQTELAQVKCKNQGSGFLGQAVGILGINGCTSYEQKEQAPEGFVLV